MAQAGSSARRLALAAVVFAFLALGFLMLGVAQESVAAAAWGVAFALPAAGCAWLLRRQGRGVLAALA